MPVFIRKLFPLPCNLDPTKGFTLIELLVAISILAVVGTLLFVDFAPFREEQDLLLAVSATQSFIRIAQVNATSGILCDNISGAVWSVESTDISNQLVIKCNTTNIKSSATLQKSLILKGGVNISELQVDTKDNFNTEPLPRKCDNKDSLTISFSPILGKVSFSSVAEGEVEQCITKDDQFVGIVLEKEGVKKAVIISKGGVVYVQDLED